MSGKLVIVDLQPSYESWFNHLDYQSLRRLIMQSKEVLWMFNGTEQTDDSHYSMYDWVMDTFNLKQKKLDSITFVEKEYGFFRDYMDTYVPDSITIKVIQHLLNNIERDANQEFLEKVLSRCELDEIGVHCNLYLPCQEVLDTIQQWKHSTVIGGGRNECLKEIELLMQSLHLPYKLDTQYVY